VIPGYMPAMTMPFAVEPDGKVPALAAGDRVRFTLRVGAESSRAERFVVNGRDEKVAAAASLSEPAKGKRLKKGDVVPAFSLITQRGRPFTSDDLRGHLTAITFIYTRCPMPEFCPLMVRRFQQLQQEMVKNPALQGVQLLSVTLDPAFDTPEILESYAAAKGADGNRWHFLTGHATEITRLTTAFSVHTERNGIVLDHTLATAIVDADGRIVEIWRGNGWPLAEVVTVLQREAGQQPRESATPAGSRR
jgi:protein SCO1/2